MKLVKSILEVTVMDAGLKLRVSSTVAFFIGLATATGHLDARYADQTANDISAFVGGLLTLLSAFYFFEHNFMEVREDIKHLIWEAPAPTTPDAAVETTPPTPATPTV